MKVFLIIPVVVGVLWALYLGIVIWHLNRIERRDDAESASPEEQP